MISSHSWDLASGATSGSDRSMRTYRLHRFGGDFDIFHIV
nr:MAG TPA: hypothetical protein [Caudoviricetes sp.]